MPRHLCEQCNQPSDDIDGLCSTCRDQIERDLMVDGMSALEYETWKAAQANAAYQSLHKAMEPTDAEIERSQALIASVLGVDHRRLSELEQALCREPSKEHRRELEREYHEVWESIHERDH